MKFLTMAGRGASGRGVAGGGAGPDGPRIPRPMYEPINTAVPSASDREMDRRLEAFMAENVPVMSRADLRRREVVLGKLRTIFLQVSSWVSSLVSTPLLVRCCRSVTSRWTIVKNMHLLSYRTCVHVFRAAALVTFSRAAWFSSLS